MRRVLAFCLYLMAALSLEALTFSVSEETPRKMVERSSIICIGEVQASGTEGYQFRVERNLKGNAAVGKTYPLGGEFIGLIISDDFFEKNLRSTQTIFLGEMTPEGVLTTTNFLWSFWPQGFVLVPGNVGNTFTDSLKFIEETLAKQKAEKK